MKVSEPIVPPVEDAPAQPKNGKRQLFIYPTLEEQERLKKYAEETRRSIGQAVLFLAITQLDEIEGEK